MSRGAARVAPVFFLRRLFAAFPIELLHLAGDRLDCGCDRGEEIRPYTVTDVPPVPAIVRNDGRRPGFLESNLIASLKRGDPERDRVFRGPHFLLVLSSCSRFRRDRIAFLADSVRAHFEEQKSFFRLIEKNSSRQDGRAQTAPRPHPERS